MSGKTLNNAELELTQRIQLYFPRGTDLRIVQAWNGCPKNILTEKLAEVFCQLPRPIVSILRLISGEEVLVLDECDGSEGLADARDMFAWIDSDFNDYGANKKGPATGKTPVAVYEMKKDSTFSQMFGSLSSDVGKLCLTPHQIKNFVKKYRNWLQKDGYGTFFLFQSRNLFFVAGVGFSSGGGHKVGVNRFERGGVWNAENRHRLVVPKLAAR